MSACNQVCGWCNYTAQYVFCTGCPAPSLTPPSPTNFFDRPATLNDQLIHNISIYSFMSIGSQTAHLSASEIRKVRSGGAPCTLFGSQRIVHTMMHVHSIMRCGYETPAASTLQKGGCQCPCSNEEVRLQRGYLCGQGGLPSSGAQDDGGALPQEGTLGIITQ